MKSWKNLCTWCYYVVSIDRVNGYHTLALASPQSHRLAGKKRVVEELRKVIAPTVVIVYVVSVRQHRCIVRASLPVVRGLPRAELEEVKSGEMPTYCQTSPWRSLWPHILWPVRCPLHSWPHPSLPPSSGERHP